MGTLDIKNLRDETIERIKGAAKARGWSVEQEICSLIEAHYSDRGLAIERIRGRRKVLRGATAAQIDKWISEGRE